MNKKIKIIYILIFVVVISIVSFSVYETYTYFAARAENTGQNISGSTNDIDMDLKVNRISTKASASLIPLDNDINSLTSAAKGYGFSGSSFDANKSCIDKNGYTVCQIYEVTLTNKNSGNITVSGGVTSLTGNKTPNIACAVMATNISVTSNNTCVGTATLANNDVINGNSSKKYYMLVYVNNLNKKQDDTGQFNGTVTFRSEAEVIFENFS